MTKKRVLPIARLLLVIAAPFLWYWLFGWGTVHIIDFSAQEVEYVQISCSHYPERGAIYDPGEIQALIDEANAMQNKGTSLKLLLHGIGMGGSILYDCDFYLTRIFTDLCLRRERRSGISEGFNLLVSILDHRGRHSRPYVPGLDGGIFPVV